MESIDFEKEAQTVVGDVSTNDSSAGDLGAWRALVIVYRKRGFIIAFTLLMAVAAVVISLLLPKWYLSTTRLLLPEGGGSLTSALLGNLSSAAESLLGARGDYVRYLAILSSRSTFEEVVIEFDLITVYNLADSETPRLDAVKMLRDNVEFTIDDEYDYLSIEVLDRDPTRAAAMANFFVARLNTKNARLASQSASGFRRYAENRYEGARQERTQLLDSLKSFQTKYGVFDLEAQASAYFEQLAALRQSAVEYEIQYEALRQRLGPDNPRVQGLADLVEAANRKYAAALDGKERVLPVASTAMPEALREYADLTLDRIIQEKILEVLAPMVEQARFEEMREVEAVQVLDEAVPPEKKAKPHRAAIVIVITFSAFVLAVVFVILLQWWDDNHRYLIERLSRAGSSA